MTEDLKITKTATSKNNEVELFVEAPVQFADRVYLRTLKDLSVNIDIPGFRKGKAPKEIIEKRVGSGYVSQKAFEGVFYEILASAAVKEKLDVIDVLEIKSFELFPGKPLTFKTIVELKPEVKLGKYKNLKVNAKKVVYQKDTFIKKTLEKLSANLVTFQKVNDRPVNEGDLITIDFEGKFDDGSDVPGGKAENYQAVLEKDKFLPDFVDKLNGVKIDETKEIKVTFPSNYAEGFSGKNATFKVSVKSIEEKVFPEVNDEFAKKLGLENLDKLKQKIVTQMEELQNLNSQADFENKIVEQVIKSSKFDISERMTEKEIDYLLSDIKAQCEKKEIDWSAFKADEKNKELLKNARETGVKRISIDLVLNAIIKQESITAVPEEVDNEVKNRISQLGEKYKMLENDLRFRNTVEMVILRNKAVDFLLKNNEVVWEKEVTKIIPE